MSTILVTGGAGYIGSHTAVELLNAGHQVVIVDNLCNSSAKVLDRIEALAGKNCSFVQADVRDGAALDRIFAEHRIDGVIHFAGLKAVGESVAQPLRYFNPVGAHISGTLGENPSGTPNNLMPFITQVAVGQREFLSIFGKDYPTPDGTGVRDYIHVVDLAQGHLAALKFLHDRQASITVNLGTGRGVSVQELADTFARVTGVPVPYRFVERRPGDVAACYADTRLAQEALGWQAQLGVERMCQDAWRWQSNNPKGY